MGRRALYIYITMEIDTYGHCHGRNTCLVWNLLNNVAISIELYIYVYIYIYIYIYIYKIYIYYIYSSVYYLHCEYNADMAACHSATLCLS